MVTIEQIAERMRRVKKKNHQNDNSTENENVNAWKPTTIEDYVVPPFNIVESNAKGAEQKRRNVLSKILAFVYTAQRRRESNACTIMPISVTSNANLLIWGTGKNVSRAIDKMIEIGLISQHNEKYRFNAPFPYEDENRGKTYKYYYANELKFIDYCKTHNIEKFKPVNACEFTPKDKLAIQKVDNSFKEFKIEDVIFSANLHLVKPVDVSMTDYETYLLYCLYNNYPEFRFHQIKVDEINENYYQDYPEFAIRFKPHFTWNDKKTAVVKIGIRATNAFCNKEKDDKKEVLKEYGLDLQHDIKSSVPRLTLSLNKGEWVDESVDIYELINKELDPNTGFGDDRRNAIKDLHMSAYFDDNSDLLMGKNIWYRMLKEGIDKDEVYDVMKKFKEAVIRAEGGKLYGSEIFYVESCVYLMTLYDLLSAGHMVWVVYDAFYAKGGSDREDYDLMISNGVRINFKAFYEKSKYNR